jgi:hypothetical protein
MAANNYPNLETKWFLRSINHKKLHEKFNLGNQMQITECVCLVFDYSTEEVINYSSCPVSTHKWIETGNMIVSLHAELHQY